jgi:hypothetical protein
MNLTTFDAENVVSTRRGDAVISFSRKSVNRISKKAAELTGYEPGDTIALHQDVEHPEDWYVSLCESGFELRDDKGSGPLLFNSTGISNMILDALEINEDAVSFKLSETATVIEEVNYWLLITAKPIIKKRKSKK